MTELVWSGAEKLRSALVPLDQVHQHPRNPRRGDAQEISRSLARFGQVRAILIDEQGTIVAGNHTWQAAKLLGWTHVAVVTNRFTPEEAIAYLLADNRLGDQGEYDRAELVAFLEDLERTDAWEGTGYVADDLAHYRALEAAASAPPPSPAAPPPPEPPVRAGAGEVREVVLLLTDEQHAQFGANVRTLRSKYGLEGVTETVLRGITEEALLLNQGDADAA